MEFQYYTGSQNQDVSLKRKRAESDGLAKMFTQNASSILTNIDWVDHVVADADVATNVPLKISSKPNLCQEVKSVESSLQEFFTNMIQSRGYPGSTHSTLSCGYNNKPTQHQISSYGVAFTKAVRSSNLQQIKSFIFESGLNPNACNKFGESVVHLVCRRGYHAVLQLLLEAGCSVQVCDDFGRTPLHDACWTPSPNFQLISMLLDQDPWLFCLKDCRGTTPLGYVKDQSHCKLWMEYLKKVADKYWPYSREHECTTSPDDPNNKTNLKESIRLRSKTSPLVLLEPNSKPLPCLKLTSSLDVIEQVANGLLQPGGTSNGKVPTEQTDLKKCQGERGGGGIGIRRITLDPMRIKGAPNNATGLFPSTTHVLQPMNSMCTELNLRNNCIYEMKS